MSTLTSAINASASALDAQRARMEVAISNLANTDSGRTEHGEPYRRRQVILESAPANQFEGAFNATGVRVAEIVTDQAEFERVWDPGHPNADAEGFVAMPNTDIPGDMVDMISAARAYQANLAAITVVRETIAKALELGR